MTENDVKQLLVETGAILEGHFLLTSGLHSPMYVEKFQVLQYPEHTARMCAALAEQFADEQVELVIGPVTGGILLAHEVGKNLKTRAIFTERENGKMTLRRGFVIKPGERVLIVEDIVTTGGSVQEVLEVVREHGGIPVGVGLLVDRSGGTVDFGIPAKSLLQLQVQTYQQDDCPLCQNQVPMTKRGSKNIK
ncbi:MAG TPA: orotate phosphoribosyltransferase [Sporomusaceae bacterium]|jgi:orotate phosphoribosyltransferase|uniref:orotate phosphoribosyltransferase n=1 Tax=Anaerospora sp. TaxID=1960278 RepID=UPI000EC711E8|nr:orotate phosphoribosyltransferase [Anaerospora sp.]MDF2930030.1 Orotate phosphoribosyltransferase [Anaerospora sp.]HAK73623.1 orotate phosphoribosyltransferase [Sporomusaceae bacterium]